MVAYNIPYFNDGDTMAFLTAVARSTGRLRKVSYWSYCIRSKADNQGNSPDLESAAKHLVRDWAQNTFPYYSTPKASGASAMEVDDAAQPDMSAVLEKCSSRKDMRKVGKGVIRFKGGEVDTREIVLDDDYTEGLAPSDDEDEEEGDDEDEEELEVDGLDSDEEVVEGADFEVESASEGDEEEEEEEEEEESEPEPVSRKLKRKADPVASPGEKKKARTHKRVSFGGRLGATGSSEAIEKEVKSILKRDRNGETKAAVAVKEAPAKKAAVAAVTAPVSNGKSKKTKGTYDFSAHFA
jgi:nuclear GTP-binding protein